jgi:hypothetical protein
LKLKKFVGAAKPSIYKAIDVFKSENVDAEMKFRRSENASEPRSLRNKLSIIKDELWYNYKKMLAENEITLKVYFKYVSNLFMLEQAENNEDERETECSEESSEDE